MQIIATKPPLHLWIIGTLAVLWNGFGCFDYFMTRTQGAAYIRDMMPGVDALAFMAWLDRFPIWASVGWALGVWGGLAGSILLLMRRWAAVPVFGVSLAGAVIGIGYQIARPPQVAGLADGVNDVVHYVILGVAIGLLVYARAMKAKGVLH